MSQTKQNNTGASAPKAVEKIIRKFKGIVVGDAMDKTIVVRIAGVKTHPKYKKSFAVSKKYKVHDEKNQFKQGDAVTFVQCRPLSKEKRWRVLYTDAH